MGVAGDVDQDVAEQAVDQPRRHRFAAARLRHFADRDFKLVEQILARLVDARRLAGRPDEQTGKQIRQRRVPQHVEHQALEQIGPPQERTVGGAQSAEHDVVAAAGPGVPAVDHEFVGAEPRGARVPVDAARDVDGFAPGRCRLDIDLDDAGIGRHFENVEPRVGRRRIAFEVDRQVEFGRGRFDGGDEVEIVIERFDRRHEDAKAAVAHLDGERGAHRQIGAPALCGGARRRLLRDGRRRERRRCRLRGRGQRPAFGKRVGRHDMRIVRGRKIGQRLQRQPQAERRIAGDQKQSAAARLPDFAEPCRFGRRRPASQRQHEARRLAEMRVEQTEVE